MRFAFFRASSSPAVHASRCCNFSISPVAHGLRGGVGALSRVAVYGTWFISDPEAGRKVLLKKRRLSTCHLLDIFSSSCRSVFFGQVSCHTPECEPRFLPRKVVSYTGAGAVRTPDSSVLPTKYKTRNMNGRHGGAKTLQRRTMRSIRHIHRTYNILEYVCSPRPVLLFFISFIGYPSAYSYVAFRAAP